MGNLAIKSILLPIICILLFSTTAIAADKKTIPAPAVVTKLESHLFFKTYDDESVESRVDRIEKQVFGETAAQPLPNRIARLESVLEQQIRDATLIPSPNNASQPMTEQNQAPTNPVTQNPTNTNTGYSQERSRVSVQAAREAEIKDLLSQGVDFWRNKKVTEARSKFEQVLRLDPTNSEAHFSLGIISEAQGNLVQALASYETALNNSPNNHEYKDAIESAKKLLSKNDQVSAKQVELRKLSDLATQAFRRGEYVSALDLYKQLDEKAPNQGLIKYNIGSIYLMMKDQNNAFTYYKQAHKLAPKEPRYTNAYENLAQEIHKADLAKQEEARQEEAERRQQIYLAKQSAKQSKMQQSQPAWRASPGAAGFRAPAPVTGYGQAMPYQQPVQQMPMQSQMQNRQPMSMPQAMPMQSPMELLGFAGHGSGEGVVVTKVISTSRAGQSGLIPKDVIRAIDGFEVYKIEEVNNLLSKKQLSQPIQMLIQRNGNLAVINM